MPIYGPKTWKISVINENIYRSSLNNIEYAEKEIVISL